MSGAIINLAILRALDKAKPHALREDFILDHCKDFAVGSTITEVRQSLRQLENSRLIVSIPATVVSPAKFRITEAGTAEVIASLA